MNLFEIERQSCFVRSAGEGGTAVVNKACSIVSVVYLALAASAFALRCIIFYFFFYPASRLLYFSPATFPTHYTTATQA
jgi:hypothetical protein